VAGIDYRVDRRAGLFFLEILREKINGGLTSRDHAD
jgi:hypothetical protein